MEARNYLNRNGSEEKLKNSGQIGLAGQGGMMYQGNRKPSIEQRYKSHLRGQDAPGGQVGLVRNQSKPALQLPEIKNNFGK